ASKVCLSSSSGCMVDDFPELFAPARRVRGAISMRVSCAIDLKPATVIAVISGTESFAFAMGRVSLDSDDFGDHLAVLVEDIKALLLLLGFRRYIEKRNRLA